MHQVGQPGVWFEKADDYPDDSRGIDQYPLGNTDKWHYLGFQKGQVKLHSYMQASSFQIGDYSIAQRSNAHGAHITDDERYIIPHFHANTFQHWYPILLRFSGTAGTVAGTPEDGR